MNTTPEKRSFFSSMTRKKLGVMVASFIVFSATLSVLTYEGTKKTVALTIDGEQMTVKTHASTVGDVLNELEIPVKDTDYLSHTPDTAVKNHLNIVWEKALQVAVKIDDEESVHWTTAKTVKDFLDEEEIEINDYDKIDFSLQDAIKDRLVLNIERAFPLTLQDGEKEKKVWSTSTTVADFLKQQDIKLGDLDRVEPNLKDDVEPKATVKVIRVEKVTDVVEEPIDYALVTKKDSSMMKGTEKVIQEGKEGLLKKEYEVTKENGKEVDRELIAEETVNDSQDKVVAVGTKVMVAQVSRGKTLTTTASKSSNSSSNSSGESSSAPEGGNEITMSATAYTASCNGCSGVTATGINLKANPGSKVIAVDPNVIPLGSKVWVEGYGYAVAGDTGGAIKGNRIDVFVPSKDQAYRFGRKNVKVRVLN
ncbi:ubiquitin-like domain-containing protein [Lederbergia sp. NSJ-179]|uniref:G5 and 3D domain-containing protein n=1 Tax=Lederbergia sp. NSJ-179 TaxID=2931402 RepID=UPI001FD29A72|nr:G5 and 3D domain-containing protein [Lederbergia sp. NSJ-179]MCJ7842919.1 ubiquitin-like domain-containing protein [Lederbergia sp. NSJ-179]